MTMLPGNKLFPTLAVGSLPRDQWVFDVVEARNEGRIGTAEAELLLDGAAMSAVRMQEQAGLDFVSDGEWRRNSYLRVFFDAVDGYAPDLLPPRPFNTAPLPAVVSPIVPAAQTAEPVRRGVLEGARPGTDDRDAPRPRHRRRQDVERRALGFSLQERRGGDGGLRPDNQRRDP